MTTKFGYTVVYVRDVEATINWYQQVFGIGLKFINPEKTYAELLTGDTTLVFANDNFQRQNYPGFTENKADKEPAGLNLSFITDNVGELFSKAITEGAIMIKNVETKPWGQIEGWLRDLNGILITIVSPSN